MLCAVGACGDPSAHRDAAPDGATVPDAPITIDAPPTLEPIPDPQRIAGPLTLAAWGTQPFLTPAMVDDVLQTGFSIGREFFVAAWVAAPNATRPNIDGLGPLLHATSCVACHPASGRPPSLRANGTVDVGVLFRLARTGSLAPDPIFGGQLQPSAIGAVPPEATVTWRSEASRVVFEIATHPAYGALASDTHASARLSPQLAGMGLLELVTDQALLALEDPDDDNGDGISGRAARLGATLGRFGWKAVQPDLEGQTIAAFANDIGIASATRGDDCTAAQTACTSAPSGGAPEITTPDLDAVDTFSRFLGVPAARRDNADPQMVRGHELFVAAQCAACHRPTLTTGTAPSPTLANVTFHAYTDLLLHDMGPDLADAVGEGDASAAEWRTPPLWGIGLVAADPAARFLHDGRAATIEHAIRWHAGEASAARAAFEALSASDREALLAYIHSL